MTIRRIASTLAVSLVMGLFVWFVLLFIHEEWREYTMAGTAGPPPFNPFHLWVPVVLTAGIWWGLNALLRWADKPEHFPQGR